MNAYDRRPLGSPPDPFRAAPRRFGVPPSPRMNDSDPGTIDPLDLSAIAAPLEAWFAHAQRDLPWRNAVPDPDQRGYRVLVSEAMLQQTQVSRVIDAFNRFLQRFPTVNALAAAGEQSVLHAWQGLGYYRRARQLHAAARVIVERFGGRMPRTADELRQLPGVGPYTAGAIASIAFDARAPIVDGNVMRVMARLFAIADPPDEPATQRRVWALAETGVTRCTSPRIFNQALMELGATVCTPRRPACASRCPLNHTCAAWQRGLVDTIPPPRRRASKQHLWAYAMVIARRGGIEILLTQRPREGRGLWAGMWQIPTLEQDAPLTQESPDGEADAEQRHVRDRCAAAAGGESAPVAMVTSLEGHLVSAHGIRPRPGTTWRLLARFERQTTHRIVHFSVLELAWPDAATAIAVPPPRRPGTVVEGRPRQAIWVARSALAAHPMANAQIKVLAAGGFAVAAAALAPPES